MIAASFSLKLYCLFMFYKPPEASWEDLCTNRSDALATALLWKVISGQEEVSCDHLETGFFCCSLLLLLS